MNFKDLSKKLAKILDNVGEARQMDRVAKVAAKEVRDRTRDGYGVPKPLSKRERLKKLKETYQKRRQSLRKQGKLSSQTTPTKSNLTKSGEMIDNVDGRGSKNKAEVFVKGKKNKDKAAQQSDAGRTFMNLSKKEAEKAVNIIKEDIEKDIKKNGL